MRKLLAGISVLSFLLAMPAVSATPLDPSASASRGVSCPPTCDYVVKTTATLGVKKAANRIIFAGAISPVEIEGPTDQQECLSFRRYALLRQSRRGPVQFSGGTLSDMGTFRLKLAARQVPPGGYYFKVSKLAYADFYANLVLCAPATSNPVKVK